MTRIAATAALVLLAAGPLYAQDDQYARGLVVEALKLPNDLGVSGREFKTKTNPKGEGVFVYDPRTRFSGVSRNLLWLVVDHQAYPLNGPSKTLTPRLRWPREADPKGWEKTGLNAYVATEAIEIVFGSDLGSGERSEYGWRRSWHAPGMSSPSSTRSIERQVWRPSKRKALP